MATSGSGNQCRFCGNVSVLTVPLHEPADFSTSEWSLAEVVHDLTGVRILPSDDDQQSGAPQQICVEQCLKRLTDAYKFKQQIVAAEAQLRIPETIALKLEDESAKCTSDGEYETEFLVYEEEEGTDKGEHKHDNNPSSGVIVPPKEMIVTQLEFENFDYIEFRGVRCCGCEIFLEDEDQLKVHCTEHHKPAEDSKERASYSCDICRNSFPSEADRTKHKEYFAMKELFLCKLCQKGFHGKDALMDHMDYHQSLNDDQTSDGMEVDDEVYTPNEEAFVEPPATDGQDIEIEYKVTGGPNHKYQSQRNATKLPDQELISSVDDYDQYQIVHVENAERCCGCGVYFGSYEQMVQHAQLEHQRSKSLPSDKPFCEICYESFKAPWALNAHKTHCRFVKELYYCKLCDIVYAKKFHMVKHFQTTAEHELDIKILGSGTTPSRNQPKNKDCENETSFACCFLKCSFVSENEQVLLDHVLDHHQPRRKINITERTSVDNVCSVCQRSFGSNQLLLLHRNRSLKKKHICSFCGEAFLIPSKLREHELLLHSGTVPQHPCDICSKPFRTTNLLKMHRLTHGVEREFQCDQCIARFRFRFQLRKHIQGVHPTTFPYECSYCEKKFSTKPKHDLHLRSHTGEKPYPCRYDACGKHFSHVTDRKRHEMGVHTGERPYRCVQCSAAYIRKRELLIHLQKHQLDK